jgi:hypothetical protein
MRNYFMTEHEAITKIRPQTRADRTSLWKICGFVATALLIVIGIFVLRQKDQAIRERTWQSAQGTIEDVRPVIASQLESKFARSVMLYRLEVLVRYTANGSEVRRWVDVPQQPVTLDNAQWDAFRWKGQKCRIRWKPSNPDQIIAEVN